MKAIILARVSTEEQKEAGNSLPAQQARLRSYIDRSPNLELIREFIFDESASKEQRKKFSKVIEYIKSLNEPVALCCDKVDRLSRDFLIGVVELEKLRREGKIELHFASDAVNRIHKDSTAGELFAYNMMLSGAQYYANCISDNVKRAFEQKRRNGEWTGSSPIGYESVPLDKEKRLRSDIIFDPERAHLIKRLFELWSTGIYSTTAVWEKISKEGLRSKQGKQLARSNIVHILKDSFYCGIARSKHGSYEHRYPRIIDRALFNKCQEVFSERGKKRSKVTLDQYILQGLLRCADCGCLYSPETHKNNNYYSCTNAKRKHDKRVYVNEKELLKPIYDVLNKFEDIPKGVQEKLVEELRKSNEAEIVFRNREISRIRTEYDRSKEKTDRLLDLLLDKSITKDEHDKKLQKEKDLQYRLEIELEEHTRADHEYHIHVSTVLNLSRYMKEVFESSEVSGKRQILNYLLQNPTVNGKNLEFSLKKPFDTVLELASCPTMLRW